MSNTACIAALTREIAAIGVGLHRVQARVPLSWAARELDAARSDLASAQFRLAVALRVGVDPVIEVTA